MDQREIIAEEKMSIFEEIAIDFIQNYTQRKKDGEINKGYQIIKLNENESKTSKLWEAVKAILRGNFITLNVYIRKEGNSQVNNLSSHLKKLAKKE